MKDTFKEVADKNIPKKEKKNGPAWISQDTLRVVANRHQMRMEGKWLEATKVNGDIQKRIRKDIFKKNAGCWKSTIKKEEQENYINS